ncbi:MAG: sulfite exporter TauE/SafE family protein [Chromatiales bacterium]|nr:sulfite exporter TauE/SafE family protein [Chromatiales bacterium]
MTSDALLSAAGAYPAWAIAVSVIAVAAGAALQSAVGFGFALVAAPVLLFIDPALVPVPITLAALVLTAANFIANRHAADWRGLGWIVLGNGPGYLLGAIALTHLPLVWLAMLFGALTLAMVWLSLARIHCSPVPRWQLPMGALSGFSGVTTAMNGPPIALVYQHAAGPVVRATLSVYFFASNLILLAIFAGLNRLDMQAAAAGLLLVPGVLLGLWLGRRFSRWVDAGRTRRSILWVSALSAVAVMLRYGGF